MSKFIRVENIEQSRRTYLQHLEDIMTWLLWYELELDRIALRLWGTRLQIIEEENYSDTENWYSDTENWYSE